MTRPRKPNELALTRIFDAPLQLVWDAWTDTSQVVQWWGPRGFTLTSHEKDLRPGGFWHYTMHGPDGTDYPNRTVYHEVEPLRRLVYDHGGYDDRPPLFRVTAVFEPLPDGRTRLDMTMALENPEAAKQMGEFIKKAGGNATWDRLAEHLAKGISGRERFVINRSFSTSVETLFSMWVNPHHFTQWLPPTGSAMDFIEADIRTGGTSFFRMTDADGSALYGKIHYSAIEPPTRIGYTQEFCDAAGNTARHPQSPDWAEQMTTTVTFAAEDGGYARVMVTWEPDPAATDSEIAAFVAARGGMTTGWSGSFDKLEALLAQE